MYRFVLLFTLGAASLSLQGGSLGVASRNPIVVGVLGGAAAGAGCGFLARWCNIPGSQTMSGIINYGLLGALGGSLYGSSIPCITHKETAQKRNAELDRSIQRQKSDDAKRYLASGIFVGLFFGTDATQRAVKELSLDVYYYFQLVDKLNAEITRLTGKEKIITTSKVAVPISQLRTSNFPFGPMMQDLQRGYDEEFKAKSTIRTMVKFQE